MFFKCLTLFYHKLKMYAYKDHLKKNIHNRHNDYPGKTLSWENPTTSLHNILQQGIMSNLVADNSYKNRIMIYQKDT